MDDDELLDALPWHLRSQVLRALREHDERGGPARVWTHPADRPQHRWGTATRTPDVRWRAWDVVLLVAAMLWATLWIIAGVPLLVVFGPLGVLMLFIGITPPAMVLHRLDKRDASGVR